MGDYTGLRFAARLNRQGIDIIQYMHDVHFSKEPSAPRDTWGVVANRFPHPGLQLWSRVGRRSFIPFGELCYMPYDWEIQVAGFDGEGSARKMSMLEDGRWLVTCSLKNASQEIEQFLTFVLPILLEEPCACEVLFEADNMPDIIVVEPRPFGLPLPKELKKLR